MPNQTKQIEEERYARGTEQAYKLALNKHFYVKKRALFRKAEQVSRFCNSEVFVVIHNNDTGKIFSFTSDERFNLERISTLVLRDVQYGAFLNKNKKFLEEDFEKVKRNISQISEMNKVNNKSLEKQDDDNSDLEDSDIEQPNKFQKKEINEADMEDESNEQSNDKNLQCSERITSNTSNIGQAQSPNHMKLPQRIQLSKKAGLLTPVHFQEDNQLGNVLDLLSPMSSPQKLPFEYFSKPEMNQQHSGLLAMNQGKNNRNNKRMCRNDSIAVNTPVAGDQAKFEYVSFNYNENQEKIATNESKVIIEKQSSFDQILQTCDDTINEMQGEEENKFSNQFEQPTMTNSCSLIPKSRSHEPSSLWKFSKFSFGNK